VLDYCNLPVTEFFDGFGLAIKIIIVDLADQSAVRVFLDGIDLSVKIPIAFNFDQLVALVGFDEVGLPVTISIDGNLVAVLADPVYPFKGASRTFGSLYGTACVRANL
jgi:hypothetical protein